MNSNKPTPFTPLSRKRGPKVCPVCGDPSYSPTGIHPQCAVEQAELPLQLELAQKKAAEAKIKKKAPQKSWNKKCAKCHAEVHVRLKKCVCGHEFRM